MFKRSLVLCLLFIAFLNLAGLRSEAARLALVIGNGAYERLPLANPKNDANDMAAVLGDLGFDVLLKTDIDRRGMISSIQEFGARLQNGDVGLFYFSGHGMQSNNLNYLLPIRANVLSEADVEFEAVNASRIVSQMQQKNDLGVNLIVLDACRDNPYKSYMKSVSSGLAQMDSPSGSLIAYATAPGTVAYGDGRERNSIYTKQLLAVLRNNPNLNISELFIKVRKQVLHATERQQTPWEASSLTEQFCFGKCGIQQQTAQIAELLGACEKHFQANRLTTGRGGTALECYEKVLMLDPDNAEALNGLQRIEARYAEWIDKALQRGQKEKARKYLTSLRTLNQESPFLAELEALLADPISTPSPSPTATPTSLPTKVPTPRVVFPAITPTPLPTFLPPTPAHKPKTKGFLRSVPKMLSEKEKEKEFGLDKQGRPLTYFNNDFEIQRKIVIDHATGLMWQRSGSERELTYDEIEAYVKKLNQQTFAGYKDWRIPTVPELMTLLKAKRSSNGLYIHTVFDKKQQWCWSADKASDWSAWLVHFGYGSVDKYYFEESYYVRCVRSM